MRKIWGFTTAAMWVAALLLAAFSGRAQSATVGNAESVFTAGNVFSIQSDTARVEVRFLGRDIARVEISAPEIDADMQTWMTLPDAFQEASVRHDVAKREIGTLDLRVAYETKPFALAFSKPGGEPLLRLAADGVSWGPDGAYELRFQKEGGDRFFGLGEPMPGLIGEPIDIDYRGHSRPIWNAHVPPSNLGLPFFLNPRGYALLVENPWKADFDFGRGETFEYKAGGGPIRFYVFVGDSHYDILANYHQLTGASPIPPRWALGFLQSRYGYKSEEEFRDVMNNFRDRDIPADGLIFDLDWFGGGKMGNLWWTSENFPHALDFQKEIDSRNFNAITIVEPYIMAGSENYREAQDKNILVRTAEGKPYIFGFWGGVDAGLFDYFNPDMQAWWKTKIARIKNSGVDGWWTDLNEPEKDYEDMHYYGGVPNLGGHNLQALLMHKSMQDLYDEQFPDERLFIMTRSGFVGDWRYGTGIWSGDVSATWGHLGDQIPIAISASLSGYGYWNSDIGGFHGHPTEELFTRWMQFGAFNPTFRAHGNHDPREPWAYGEEAEKNIKSVFQLRYRLSPYLYNLCYELYAAGKPQIRAMFLEFPDDEKTYDEMDQFMYGPALLVAPVVKPGVTTRSVYLPEGEWTEMWTGKRATGPRKIKVPAPMDRIPLFVRDGSIVPIGPPVEYMDERPLDPAAINIFATDRKADWFLYEDDGKSNGYRRGESSIIPISAEPGATARITVGPREGEYPGMLKTRDWLFVWHHRAKPATVSLNGASLPQKDADVELNKPEAAAWSYDAEKEAVKIFAPATGADLSVEMRDAE